MQSIITCGLLGKGMYENEAFTSYSSVFLCVKCVTETFLFPTGVEYDPDLDVDDYYSLTNRRHSFSGHFESDRLSENRSRASPHHSYSSVRGNSSPPSVSVLPLCVGNGPIKFLLT